MTNYSERRQQQHDARQAVNEQNTRDYIRGANGIETWSTWGQLGKQNSGGGISKFGGTSSGGMSGGVARASQPFLPGIDRWVDSIPFPVFGILGFGGAIAAYCYSTAHGLDQSECLLNAGAGGFAGMISLYALAKLFKIAVGAAMIAAVCFGIYYFGFAH